MKETENKDGLLAMIRDGKIMSLRQQLLLTAQLSMPAIMAQLSSIIMQYIDASMVGHLGANEAAAIGLVSTTLWMFGGLCNAFTIGFSVQVAHLIGAKRSDKARSVLRQAIVASLLAGLLIASIGALISPFLPVWLGGNSEICGDSSTYFLIFSLCIPFVIFNMLASGMLRCSGNMRVPSMLNILMAVLDVIFNFLLIFPSRDISFLGNVITVPGAGLGVTGAALGTGLAESLVALLMVYYLVLRSGDLKLTQDKGSFKPTRKVVVKAVRISFPMALQQFVMSTAHIMTTMIVAPLGNVSIAANSLAITAESLCYMPGYGIADAATTLVGQCLGAGRRYLCRQFARISVALGMSVMGVMGVFMFICAPYMMELMTGVDSVISLGVDILRIEAFAEPLFAAAIVTYGVFVGAGDTVAPCIMNVASVWCVRLTLAWLFVNVFAMGLIGMWIAMAVELCARGSLFLLRLWRGNWMKQKLITQ